MKIEIGLFAEDIEKQLKDGGFKFKDEKDVKKYKLIIKSWNVLMVHGIATDSEADKMANRILKRLSKDVTKEECVNE